VLGRKNFTQEELDAARSAVDAQLAAYRTLGAPADGVEATYFNAMALALDRRFVHRLRGVTGKDGTPLNELELIADSLMNNDGVLQGNTVVTYDAGRSVTGLKIGDPVGLTAGDFERLATGVLDELTAKYLG
jgi:adhesin HecA-like repeat protein